MFFSRHITRNTLTYGQTEFVLAGSLKRKNDITRCFTTCYAVMSCGGRIGLFYLKRPTLPFL